MVNSKWVTGMSPWPCNPDMLAGWCLGLLGLMEWCTVIRAPTKISSCLCPARASLGQRAGGSCQHPALSSTGDSSPPFYPCILRYFRQGDHCSALSKKLHYRAAFLARGTAHQYVVLLVAGCRLSQNAPKIQSATHQPQFFSF